MDVILLQSRVGDSSKKSEKRWKRRSKKQDVGKPGAENRTQMSDNSEASEKVTDNELKKDLYGTELTEKPLSETPKTDAGSIENLSEKHANGKKKRKKKKKARIQDEVQSMEPTNRDQINDTLEKIANNKLEKDLLEKDITEQPLSENPKIVAVSVENLSECCANRKRKKKKKNKATIEDEVQRMEPINIDQMNDDLEASEKVANSKPKKDTLEIDLTEQPVSENPKINAGSIENLSEDTANRKNKRKKKKKKATTQDEIQSMDPTNRDQMNFNLEASEKGANGKLEMRLSETDLTEQLSSENPKIDAGPMENLSGECVNRGKKRKKKNATYQDEVQQMELTNRDEMDDNLNASEEVANSKLEKDHSETDLTEEPLSENPKIESGSIENISGECQNRKQKITKKKKKATIQDEVQSVEQTNRDQMNHDVEASEEVANSKLRKDLFETDLTAQPLSEVPKIVAGSIEIFPMECANRKQKKKKKKKKKKKGKIQDEVQSVEPTNRDQMNDNMEAFENVANCKLKQDLSETDITQQPLSEYPKTDLGLIENISECASRKKKRKKKKKATIQDEVQSMEPANIDSWSTENLAEAAKEHIEKAEIKEENDGESENKSKAGSMLNLNLSDENHEWRIDGKLRTDGTNQESELSIRKEDGPCHSDHGEGKNGSSLLNNGVVLDSGCHVRDPACLYPKMGPSISIRRKLLVLDVNGLLADIMMCPEKHCTGDTRILGRSIHRRPFCDDFLKFCFQNFDVGIWSSRAMKVIHPIVNFLLGDLKNRLLFCWDMLHCTQTGLRTLENRHKPLVCKELRKIWGNHGCNSPWKKGDYNETNTLLLDDSPYKALLNPPHTAIFPYSYSYVDKEKDKSLGPEGDLRAYLEGLIKYDNVQKYVEQHPFGQKAISEEHSSWEFYKTVLSGKKSEDKTNSS